VNDLNRRTAAQTRNAVPQEVSGVLETLAAGLSLVMYRPYLFVLPLIVDLWTWLGVQVRPTSVVLAMQKLLIEQGGNNGADAARELGSVSDRLRVNDILAGLTPSIFSGLPHDTLLANLLTLMAPALTDGVDRTQLYADWSNGLGAMIAPESEAKVFGLGLLFFLGATILLSLFKVPIAQAVRGGEASIGSFVKDVALGWIRVLALIGIVAGIFLVVVIPVLVIAQLFTLIGIPLIAMISLAVFLLGGIAAISLYFLVDAMFIYRVWPVQAARMSYAVARINFSQTWRFAAASVLIATGVLQVWSVIVENPPGIVAALVINAALGTGLSIASMMFFHDRARLPRLRTSQRSFPLSRPSSPQSPRR
jgi:hypothetical protein